MTKIVFGQYLRYINLVHMCIRTVYRRDPRQLINSCLHSFDQVLMRASRLRL